MNPFRPRRIKITEPNFLNMSGYFGTIEFADGVSVDPVPWQEQQRLGGLIRFVSAEDDESEAQIGPAAELIRNRNMGADDERAQGVDRGVMGADGAVRLAGEFYTRDQLEEIADKKGIAGLRDVARAWGVKGRSINEMITEILTAQDKGANPAAFAAPQE